MIDLKKIFELTAIADQVPDRYRIPLFVHLLSSSNPDEDVSQTNSAPARFTMPTSDRVRSDIGQVFRESAKSEMRMLAAIHIGELEASGPVATSSLNEIYKRHRVKPPANISRDVATLIRRGLVLENHRGVNRTVLVSLTNKGVEILHGAR